jgi:putative peptidoglycan lipid II flippase
MMKSGGRMFRSVFLVSFFTVLTGILNYLVLMVLAARFGAGREMDAFFAATTIPQLMTAILLAALTTTFIPVFIEARSRDESSAWKTASISINIIFFLLSLIALAAMFSARNLISLVNPGFAGDTLSIASSLFQILIFSTIFSGTSIILTSLHYAHNKYLEPSLAQGFNSLITLLFVILTGNIFGIKSIAIGTLFGSLVQFFFLLPLLLRQGRYSFDFDFKRREVIRLGKLMLPLLAGSVFYKANPVVERFIASKLGESNISYLGYALKIITLLLLVLTQGISTTILPRMSEQSAAREIEGLRETISKGLRAMILIATPVTLALLLARAEIVRLVFERGDFTSQTTAAVAQALVAYLGFFVVGILSVPVVNALYSLQKTALVAAIGIAGFTLYVFMAFFLSSRLSYPGIALAVSMQYIINLIVFFIILQKKVGGLDPRPILRCVFKTVLASGLASLVFIVAKDFIRGRFVYPLDFLILGTLAAAIYLLFLIVLKTEELKFISLRSV